MDKRLFRNEHEKVVAGVCSGVAEYMEVDVTIIRLLFVLSTVFLVGTGILVYIVMWIVVPVNNDPSKRFSKFNDFYAGKNPFNSPNAYSQPPNTPENPVSSQGWTSSTINEDSYHTAPKKEFNTKEFKSFQKNNNETGRTVGGLFLLVIGLYFLMNEFNFIPFWFSIRKLWPLVFVAIGVSFILKSKRKNAWEDWKAQQEASTEATAAPIPTAAPAPETPAATDSNSDITSPDGPSINIDLTKKTFKMKLDRIMWGIVLLFIGGVLLLDNFNIIEFYWGSVWRFWPIFLIIAGVNILFNRNKSQIGGIISIAVLVVTLGVLFVKGQQPRDRMSWSNSSTHHDDSDNDDDNDHYESLDFFHPYTDSLSSRTVLNISGGGTSFELKGSTDSLIAAHVEKKAGNFNLETLKDDSLTTINFKMKSKSNWNMGDGSNDVDFRLNTKPIWEVHMNIGAGEVDFDLSNYKLRTFNFDGGAAALDIKLGDLLPIVDVHVKTGVADVKINIPNASGCRIKAKTGLSSKDFDGFTKLADGSYETPDFKSSNKKIFINFDGGLSSFEVKRY